MPPSAPDGADPVAAPADQPLAVAAAALFVANLTVAPVVAFLVLAWLWRTRRDTAAPLARGHLDQAFRVSLRGGALLVVIVAAIVALGGRHWPWTWVLVVLYFTFVHSTLVICGCLALAKAMSGQAYRIPILGIRHE